MIKKIFVVLIVAIAIFYFLQKETSSTENDSAELKFLIELVDKVHHSIKYGNGEKSALFTDEVLKIGEGHCGHISRMMFRELLKAEYQPEIVSIKTYQRNNHSMIQIISKDKRKILLDATTNIVYTKGAHEIANNPSLIKSNQIGKSIYPQFSNIDFWRNIRNIQFLPYLDAYVLKDFSLNKDELKSLIDFRYSSIYNSKKFSIEFSKIHRLSSIVIYPKNRHVNVNAEITCFNGNEMHVLYDDKLMDIRSLFPINLLGNDYCEKVEFEFEDAFDIRDIYLYGK